MSAEHRKKQTRMATQRIDPPKRLLDLAESAHYMGRSPWSMRSLVWAGKIPVCVDGRKWYFDKQDLDGYIQRIKKVFDV